MMMYEERVSGRRRINRSKNDFSFSFEDLTETSHIRHNDLSPAPSVHSFITLTPWILKWGGLESYGQILISINVKTKMIAFFVDISF